MASSADLPVGAVSCGDHEAQALKGWQEWQTPEGVRVIRLHYTADPDRDPDTPAGKAWFDTALKGIVGGTKSNLWRREQEIDFTVREGRAIYPTFQESVHVARHPIGAIKTRPILIGWDYGLTPAAFISQLTPLPHWNIFPGMFTETGQSIGIKRFTQMVLEYLAVTYAGHEFQHYGDPAGASKSPTDERSCFEIQADMGVYVQPGALTWNERFNSMDAALSRLSSDGTAFVQIDPRARFIIDGFKGGYCKRRIGNTDVYAEDPEKNEYSHIMNAGEYISSMLHFSRRSSPDPYTKRQTSALAETYEV